jgi:hypothetical protein
MANARELPGRISYLQKALGDALPAGAFQGPFGAKLSALSRIRNVIAHAGGELPQPIPAELTNKMAQLGITEANGYLSVPRGVAGQVLIEARSCAEEACGGVDSALERFRQPPGVQAPKTGSEAGTA